MTDHLEELEDLIIGQDVSVSYKRVSKDFSIHVNEAKKILSAFSEKHKSNVSETHLFSGKVAPKEGSSHGWHYCLVQKDDLQLLNKSKQFQNTSSHVYSVYQGLPSKETLADISTRIDNPGESFSGIQNQNVSIRESNSRRKFTTKAADPPAFTKKKTEEVKKKPEEKPVEKIVKTEEKERVEENKEDHSEKDTKPKTGTAGGNKNKKQGGIANFFQRGAVAAAPKVEPKPVVKKEEEKIEEPEPKPEIEKKSTSIKQEKPVSKKGKQSAKRKPEKITNGHSDKKRKRIMVVSDSESSDEERMEEEVVEVDEPAPPTAEAVKEEKKSPEAEGVCRERKLVDETYMDEKGFIVTKKVWVTTEVKVNEDKKENEEVKIVKEEVKKAVEEKPAAKKKQAGIMSFFSRK